MTCVAFYPFKKSILVAGGADGSIAIWDLNIGSAPITVKKRVHSAPVSGISFAPCNKHFYCSVGLDKMLLFHDINKSANGILQSYEAEFPLLSLSINDDHTVAAGNSQGTRFS